MNMTSVNFNLGPVISDGRQIRNDLHILGNGLKVRHCNAQSIKPAPYSVKFDEFRDLIVESSLDIIAVTETWLKPVVPNSAINIPGYAFCRNDRIDGRAGGVGIYISSTIQHKVILKISSIGQCEMIFVELTLGECIVLLGAVYLPNGNLESFEYSVGDIFERYANIIVVGDFNNDLYNPGKASSVRSLCNRLNLSIKHNSIPTHHDVRCNMTTLLDYFLLSGYSLLNSTNQFQCPFLNSHHAFIYGCFKLPQTSSSTTDDCIEYRDYSLVDIGLFNRCICEYDFGCFYDAMDVDYQASKMESLIQKLFSLVPVRKIKIRRKSVDWINSREAVFANSLRDIAYRAYTNDPTQYKWSIFCKYRNKAKRTMRRLKKGYFGNIFYNASTRKMWKHLAEAGNSSQANSQIRIDVDQVNDHFLNGLDVNSFNGLQSIAMNSVDGNFSFSCIDISDLCIAFGHIKSNACGVDGIPLRFIKIVFPLLSNHILHWFNSIIATSTFPRKWKLAKVIPIPKSGDSYTVSNLRPISILPILSKIFEHVIRYQIVEHIEQHDLLNDRQTGFRRGCGVSSALLGITESIREFIDRGECCVIVSLDLSKAFDRLNHIGMIRKLNRNFSFSNTSCNLIYSYLSDRRQFVSFNHKNSCIRSVSSGVAQGSVLGPLLFSMYLNDLFDFIETESCSIYAFADDIQIIFHHKSLNNVQLEINNTMLKVETWMQLNNFLLNASKTKALRFCSVHQGNITAHIGNKDLEFVDRIKILGVTIDTKLSYSHHVDNIYSKVCFTLRRIHSFNIILPYQVRYTVAHALLMSQLSFCMEVYTCSTLNNVNKIKLLINKIVRFVFNIRYSNSNLVEGRSIRDYNHISPYVHRFLNCSFVNYLTIKKLLVFYKVMKSYKPKFLAQRFRFLHSQRNIQLFIPMRHYTVYDKSFLMNIAHVWNGLSNELKSFALPYSLYRKKLLNFLQ